MGKSRIQNLSIYKFCHTAYLVEPDELANVGLDVFGEHDDVVCCHFSLYAAKMDDGEEKPHIRGGQSLVYLL